jgi:hypothetical protein
MITGGITDSDFEPESSAILVFPESSVEALFGKDWLASGTDILSDLALEVGVCCELDIPEGHPLFAGSESDFA